MIGVTAGTWRAGPEAYLGEFTYLRYVIAVGMAAAAALLERKAAGSLGFQRALRTIFAVFVIAIALNTLFHWLLMNYIDTHFSRLVADEEQRRQIEWYKRLNTPQDQIDAQLASEKDSNPFSLGSTIFGLALWYVVFFIVSVLLAAVIRKKPLAQPVNKPAEPQAL
jgi:hypothetical protein